MKRPASPFNVGLCRVLTQQTLISVATIAGFALLKNPMAALASAFGAASAIIMAMLLALKIKNLDRRLEQNRAVSVSMTLLGVALRLLLVLIFFWFGISVLDLAPLPMVIAFSLVHLGYLFNFSASKT